MKTALLLFSTYQMVLRKMHCDSLGDFIYLYLFICLFPKCSCCTYYAPDPSRLILQIVCKIIICNSFYLMVKRLLTVRETWIRSLGREDPLEKGMATHSSIHAWKILRTEKPGRLQSSGLQRIRHD